MSDFLDWKVDINRHGRDIPHWQQGEAIQFVTFRLADSMPQRVLRRWCDQRKLWMEKNPEPWDEATRRTYHSLFTQEMERYLDAGMGSCLLRERENRDVLEVVFRRDDQRRAIFYSWVIMPNHVRVLFSPLGDMGRLLKTWKGVSARRIGRGGIWQKHYRDTIIRDRGHFACVVKYIRRNPENLNPNDFSLWESDRAREVS
ncbi:transposase [Sulfuriroseicoccus oceanibius]|uniref:Transposase n=1 Tax=Sulfuriroseicoccus oceanibius TaxID=2707525 RepID=A0A6B3LEA9_9BACT|nr:transposase [Sulfuriroseicoccus oceanibius]QQL45413.1 transposase [Sulfuriroseicoccus oceanibius]